MKRTHAIKVGAAAVAAGCLVAAHGAPAVPAGPADAGLRLAAFRCDATPPPGETLIWDVKVAEVTDPLLLKGVVLDDGATRHVLCALDWCLLCNASERAFREALARAAGTDPARVAVHCVHQHTAPCADEDAHRLLDGAPAHLTSGFLDGLRARAGEAVAEAVRRLEPVDRVGCGAAPVERVASERRLVGPDGGIITRFSQGGRDPAMAELPEGDIDPLLRTITFARGDKVVARLHYYATHPQTHSCDGSASADFVGAAREALEREEGIPQVYFTGCAGNVTVGKYNNGTPQARDDLARRLHAAMRAAAAATRFAPAGPLSWRTEAVVLPVKADDGVLRQSRADLASPDAGRRVYFGAMRLATAARARQPFVLSALRLGTIRILHLPGEPMLEFQRFAQRCRPDDFVVVAGYGDCAPAYLCTDRAFTEGGYEPDASNLAPGAEPLVKGAIERLLGP